MKRSKILPMVALTLISISAHAQEAPPTADPAAAAAPVAPAAAAAPVGKPAKLGPTDEEIRSWADTTVANLVANMSYSGYGYTQLLPADTKVPEPGQKSPSFNKIGIGIGANTGSVSGTGNASSLSSGLFLRAYGEGSSGKSYEQYADPRVLKTNPLSDLSSQIRQQIDQNKDVPQNVRDARYEQARKILEQELDKQAAPYIAVYQKAKKSDASRPGGRPLYVVEGSAQYNMIGTSGTEGAYTGFKGNIKAGLGFSLKDYGKNGCDIYFLAHAEASGEKYYKLENADKAAGAVGIEQGPLCQIANSVTIMMSPSVQVGSMEHANPNGGNEIKTDWLNYAARARLIVDKKLFVSLEYGHQPGMTTAKDGSKWIANDFNGSIDYDVSDKWVLGADFRLQSYKDENASKTGNRDVKDNFAGLHAVRAF